MQDTLNRQEIEDQLRARKELMSRRFEAIEGEISAVGESIRGFAYRHPVIVAGGAILGGILVGVLTSRSRTRTELRSLPRSHRKLVDRYIDSLAEEVRHAAASGHDAASAVREALRDRVPLVVYQPGQTKAGILGNMFNIVFSTAVGWALRATGDYFTTRFDLEQAVDAWTAPPGEGGGSAAD